MLPNNNEKPQMRKESLGTAVKKEIIGILKPPNPRKELKSFPSLPECFLHDLGLIENIALDAGNLSERDIENKFSSLSLAFKTDRVSLQERHELQLRQRDIAERNVATEIRQLGASIRSLGRVCQDAETREVLARVEKQVAVLSQSTGRVASSSEQYGAVQQEARVATAIEVMLLHVDNLRRSYEREHTELEETKRVLIEHKLLVADEPASSVSRSRSTRNRSVSVIQPQPTCLEAAPPRRSSVATPPSRHQLSSPVQEPRPRSRSPSLLLRQQPERPVGVVGVGGGGEERPRQEKKTSVFHPIPETGEEGREEEKSEGKNDNNNNAETDNMNTTKSTTQASSEQRRKESRKTSHYDVNTILEELDELATRRDSSPPNSPILLTTRRPPQLPRTARELIQRRKSLLVHLSDWYSDLCWPYDEDETILGLRYAISGILATTAFAILCSTFFG